MAIADRDIKLLWGRSGAHCSFPDCPNEIVADTTDVILGHTAHIVAKSPEGPRGDPAVPPEDLDRYANLILLCPYHHTLADRDTVNFGVDTLLRMKRDHEGRVAATLAMGAPWTCNVAQLYYVNVPRLAMLAALTGEDFDFGSLDDVPYLHSLGFQLMYLLLKYENTLKRLTLSAIALDEAPRLDPEAIGATFSFSRSFRTRGVPGPDDLKRGKFTMKGDLSKDPQIYVTHRGTRLVLPLDPRWITTSTAFNDFRPPGGIGTFAGLFTLKQSISTEKMAIGTPLVIGTPPSVFDSLFGTQPAIS